MVLMKILGGFSFVLGLLIAIGLPYLDIKYTPMGMTNSAIIIGVILMGVGLYLVFTG
jgi:hypothetical protein